MTFCPTTYGSQSVPRIASIALDIVLNNWWRGTTTGIIYLKSDGSAMAADRPHRGYFPGF